MAKSRKRVVSRTSEMLSKTTRLWLGNCFVNIDKLGWKEELQTLINVATEEIHYTEIPTKFTHLKQIKSPKDALEIITKRFYWFIIQHVDFLWCNKLEYNPAIRTLGNKFLHGSYYYDYKKWKACMISIQRSFKCAAISQDYTYDDFVLLGIQTLQRTVINPGKHGSLYTSFTSNFAEELKNYIPERLILDWNNKQSDIKLSIIPDELLNRVAVQGYRDISKVLDLFVDLENRLTEQELIKIAELLSGETETIDTLTLNKVKDILKEHLADGLLVRTS